MGRVRHVPIVPPRVQGVVCCHRLPVSIIRLAEICEANPVITKWLDTNLWDC